jgi:UDP-4-amino-4-deoxy-L-arabinose-oxoglutarate aminotransferase
MAVPFYKHGLGQPELDAIAEVFKGSILTTGEWVSRFEKRFADYLGTKGALGVTSCTGALHMSLLAWDIGPGDEVITTPLTFIASSTAIMEAGAKPVFVDVEEDTGNIDAARVEAAITPRTRAILPVHLYGQMCDMKALRAIADRHKLAIFEDAAHCVEGVRDGVKPGQLGDTASFSFYATKNLTCGEGGALAWNDESKTKRLNLLRLHGMTKMAADRAREGYTHWDMTLLGWKYNMDNIQAAMLLPQMDRIEDNWVKREEVAKWYEEELQTIRGLSVPVTRPGARHARHLFPVLIGEGRRDAVIAHLQKAGVGCMVNYRAIHTLTFFKEALHYPTDAFPIASRLGDAALSLPFYPGLARAEVKEVVKEIGMALSS